MYKNKIIYKQYNLLNSIDITLFVERFRLSASAFPLFLAAEKAYYRSTDITLANSFPFRDEIHICGDCARPQ